MRTLVRASFFFAAWELLRDFPKFNAAERTEFCAPTTSEMDKVGGGSNEETGNIEGMEDGNGGTKRKFSKLERPPGRQPSKELHELREHRFEEVKMANKSLELHKQHIVELERHRDIQLLTNGLG